MPRPTNEQLSLLPQPATVALADRVRRLSAKGRRILALQTGDPDFPTPAPIVEAAHRAMKEGHTHYTHSRGIPELREAVAKKQRAFNHVEYDPTKEILITCGGVHAYYCALSAILNPEDEVLVPDPAWMTHFNTVTALRGVPIRVPAFPENDFFPTIEAWERAVSSSTKALVINSPCNPTGMVASKTYLAELNRFAERHDLYVISDEVYEHMVYDGVEHICFSTLPRAKSRTLLVNSFSKTYAMTGWRVGYLCGPEHIVSLALRISQHSITNIPPFVQRAAVFALTDDHVFAEVQAMVDAYARRRHMALRLWETLSHVPVSLNSPKGAFYIFFDLRSTALSSDDIAERLLEEKGVACVPGSVYGKCGEGFIRMTVAASDAVVEEGCRAIISWTNELQETRSSHGSVDQRKR